MKILGIHADPCHLGGHTRLFLILMDIFKSMGHDIHIVSRTSEESKAVVEVEVQDQVKMKPLMIPAEVKAQCDLSHHKISDLKKFQPVRELTPQDFSFHDIPVVYWGTHFLTPWAPEVVDMMKDADYIFGDTEMYVRIESDIDISYKHIQFVHFPTVNLLPVFGREPRYLWANSTFTRSWIRIRWGYNNPNYHQTKRKYTHVRIPNQVYNAEVVHPPIYTGDYFNDQGFEDRSYDVVMFARLGPDKFTVSNFLNEHFKLLTMGALSPVKVKNDSKNAFKPKGELHQTVSFKEVLGLLRMAKVYVHGKGFGIMGGPQSLPEHFGITVIEAMASGCPAVVPRAGGCWTDISEMGKHTKGYSSLDELKHHVHTLATDKKEWEKYHKLAIERAKTFDVKALKPRIRGLLS